MDIENRLAECLARLPLGVTVEYEIIQGAVYWRITEKPVALTLEQEQKILSDLNSIAYESSMLTGKKHVVVTQHPVTHNPDEFKTLCGKNAAYKDWLNKLSSDDQLPRGRFFKGKMAGRPRIILDEAWQFLKQN